MSEPTVRACGVVSLSRGSAHMSNRELRAYPKPDVGCASRDAGTEMRFQRVRVLGRIAGFVAVLDLPSIAVGESLTDQQMGPDRARQAGGW